MASSSISEANYLFLVHPERRYQTAKKRLFSTDNAVDGNVKSMYGFVRIHVRVRQTHSYFAQKLNPMTSSGISASMCVTQ